MLIPKNQQACYVHLPPPAFMTCQVSDAEFMTRDELRLLLASADRGEINFTPWSRYIIDNFVFNWWDHVGDKSKLESLRDTVIHRVGTCAEET